jgi:hypothetical protein
LPPDLEIADRDKPILAGAIGAGCTHLWTSDRLHFGNLYGEVFHGVRIVSSIHMADELDGKVLEGAEDPTTFPRRRELPRQLDRS